MDSLVIAAGLGDILSKVKNEERLSVEDGIRLYECPDLLANGRVRDIKRYGGLRNTGKLCYRRKSS